MLAAALPRLDDIEVTLNLPGGRKITLNPVMNTARWTTAAVGGFGSFSCQLPGRPFNRNPYLATIRVTLGQRVLYEGRVEDIDYLPSDEATEILAFGMRRELDGNTVQGIWRRTEFDWRPVKLGRQFSDGSSTPTTIVNRTVFSVTTGTVDDSDQTKRGVRFGRGADLVDGDATMMHFVLAEGSELIELHGEFENTATSTTVEGVIAEIVYDHDTNSLTSINPTSQRTTSGSFGVNPGAGTNGLLLAAAAYATPLQQMADEQYLLFYDMYALGVISEDVAGSGFYGGTLIRDILSNIPTLQAGTIDTGNEFVVGAYEAEFPTIASRLLDELTSLYSKELAVWEGGRVDWTEKDVTVPHWVVLKTDLEQGSRISGTLDQTVTKTVLLFRDATRGGDESLEEATGGGQRNPYSRLGLDKTEVLQAGFPMTPATASVLATKLNGLHADRPTVTGRVVLNAYTPIRRANGGPAPAWTIRAGENILIADLPKSEVFVAGLDGETLFHIVAADIDIARNTVTLELDGQTKRSDVLLARLAAATRVVTG